MNDRYCGVVRGVRAKRQHTGDSQPISCYTRFNRHNRALASVFRYLNAKFVVSCLAAISCQTACALDIFKYPSPDSDIDHRGAYAVSLLQEVLRRTEPEFGPYRLVFSPVRMERNRQFEALKAGSLINVAAVPSSAQWEHELIPIMIPIDLGLQSWRLSLVDIRNGNPLHVVKSLAELKRLRVGVGKTWVTYQILTDDGFNVVPGNNFDGLFAMLVAGRFDYFPRSLKDIFDEYDHRKNAIPTLAIDDSMVLHHPFPSLFFTAPGEPRLARRISVGMETMLKDGSLRLTALRFHKDLLARAALCTRHVFEIPNPTVNRTMLQRKDLWLDPTDPRNGLCPPTTPGGRRQGTHVKN
jgi:hypothetical protein